MKRAAFVLALLGLALGGTGGASAQGAKAPPSATPRPGEPRPTAPPHRTGELDCRGCHQGKHQGVLRMYLGLGGRGTPMIPSHMFQVRVECVACHIAPKEEEARARIVGQTFRPSEQACVGCHGEKYRGMLGRWTGTLAKMQEIVAPKLAAARAALAGADPKNPRHARARRLVEDAEFNTRFVALGKGVHNVFYAADLLKLANGWLDEAVGLLGQAPVQADDTLVRGGYCGVLCHEQAGVKRPETVMFGKQRIPHVRHVTEFGAVCTACHSAEVHKAVTATPATCSGCHHSLQNDRCESCHRAQAAFYRGQAQTDLVKVEPNAMADAVPCTGCHDFTLKHSRQAVGQKCVGCHDASYAAFLGEWTTGLDEEAARVSAILRRAEATLAGARRAGRETGDADALVKEARRALSLVRGARGAHNPGVAAALLEVARQKAEAALARVGPRGP
ncbi:MAG: hypothetical protein HY002_13150 [Candidatus Rokubacteria bacterium]|nr:hypothetical protein [Candidatus Rokubacteria bacterium]